MQAAPPSWGVAATSAAHALSVALNGDADEVDEALFDAYKSWANTAEEELVSTLQTKLAVMGTRGEMSKLVFKSILPQESSSSPCGNAASKVLRWVAARAREVRLASVRVLGSAGRYGEQELRGRAAAILFSQPDAISACDSAAEWLAKLRTQASLMQYLTWGDGVAATATMQGCIGQMADIEAEALRHAGELESVERQLAQSQWKEWVHMSLNNGAGAAHKWTKVPVVWRPTATLLAGGTVTADPQELLKAETVKWQAVWSAMTSPPVIPMGRRSALQRLEPEPLREASRKFSWRTATAGDGFHMRHYDLLADEGLVVLGVLLEAIEASCRLPPQLRYILMVLLEKTLGGFRPIRLFVSLYRLWGKPGAHYATNGSACMIVRILPLARAGRHLMLCGVNLPVLKLGTLWVSTQLLSFGISPNTTSISFIRYLPGGLWSWTSQMSSCVWLYLHISVHVMLRMLVWSRTRCLLAMVLLRAALRLRL